MSRTNASKFNVATVTITKCIKVQHDTLLLKGQHSYCGKDSKGGLPGYCGEDSKGGLPVIGEGLTGSTAGGALAFEPADGGCTKERRWHVLDSIKN
jgi:hypothetical protein